MTRKICVMIAAFLFSATIFAAPLSDKIVTISSIFLNKPYQLHPLDEKTLYRFDKFDCETYVDTVLALAYSDNMSDFKKNIINIRYAKLPISFYNRNNFPDADWIPNNIKKGYIKFSDINNKTISMNINKQNWYKNKAVNNAEVTLPYITSEDLSKIINQIPNGAIIFIIKPSFLLVSHMGFAIWENNQLYLRAASSYFNKITDVNLLKYVENNPDIKGISVLVAQDKK